MINIGGQEDDASYRYKMPILKVKKEGRGNGVKTVLVNILEISKCLNIEPEYPTKFFGIELCAHSSYNPKSDLCVVNGHYASDHLQNTLFEFIEKFILCDRCNLPETSIRVDGKRHRAIKKCAACGIKTLIDPSHRLTAFLIKKPPSNKKALDQKPRRGPIPTAAAAVSAATAAGSPDAAQNQRRPSAPAADTPPAISSDSDDDPNAQWSATAPSAPAAAPSAAPAAAAPETPRGPSAQKEKAEPLLTEMVRGGASEAELLAEVGRMELASPGGMTTGRLLIAQGVVRAVLGALDGREALEALDRHRRFLAAFVAQDERNAANFLDALAEHVAAQRPGLLPLAPAALERLYDGDVLSEAEILRWYDNAAEKATEKARESMGVFVDWLREAEVEEDGSCSE